MPTENASATVAREPQPGKKYFTIAEANRALPYITKVIADITACYGEVVELRRRIEACSDDEVLRSAGVQLLLADSVDGIEV